ncbi:hypothetical protein SDC9_41144 [bioreactor metagenome]|uniref:Uncharacterized protein n=1 Tax=bioreactor metagenome TaxID=1076179 RepID=A0A644VUA7_9ZZZZ
MLIHIVPSPVPQHQNPQNSTKITKRGTGVEEWKEIKCAHQEMYGWFFLLRPHSQITSLSKYISNIPFSFLNRGAGPRLRRGAARGGVSYFWGPYTFQSSSSGANHISQFLFLTWHGAKRKGLVIRRGGGLANKRGS